MHSLTVPVLMMPMRKQGRECVLSRSVGHGGVQVALYMPGQAYKDISAHV